MIWRASWVNFELMDFNMSSAVLLFFALAQTSTPEKLEYMHKVNKHGMNMWITNHISNNNLI